MDISVSYSFTDLGTTFTNGGSLPEAIGIVDLNNDGQKEIFYGVTGAINRLISEADPDFFIIEIDGQGATKKITHEIIIGDIPKLGWANDVIAEDFNNDGYNDLFIIDHGREVFVDEAYIGSKNILLLSDGNGRLVDKTNLINQNTTFWHSSINAADIEGDGDFDLVVATLSGAQNNHHYISLFENDGAGGFSDSTLGNVPQFISQSIYKGNDLIPGTSGFIDIGDDEIPDIVLLPYMNDNPETTDNSSAVFLRNDGSGNFTELHQRVDVLGSVDSEIQDTSGFSHFVVDDFNGDGLDDIIALAEDPSSSDNHVHLTSLYQNSNYNFEDTTLSSLGAYRFTVPSYNPKVSTSNNLASTKLISFDVDLDGDKDLLWPVTNSSYPSALNESLFLNDGNGNFTRDTDFLDIWTSEIDQKINGALRPIFSDINNDGVLDLIVEETTWSPYPTSLHSYFHVVMGEHFYEKFDEKTFGATYAKDFINGSSKTIDTVIFQGNYEDYVIKQDSNSIFVEQVSNAVNTDLLTDIERLKFNDTNLALDINGYNSAGAAYRLYQAAFDRLPDTQGLGYWISEIDNGMDLEGMAHSFIISDEFQSLYGSNTTDEEFVTLLYNNVLKRDPDQSGFDYWINETNNGLSRAGVLSSFSESTENKANVIDQIKTGFEYDLWLG